jgi:deoxyribodipyrimidine photo-lyase
VDLKFGTVSARATWHAAESKRTVENARAVDRFHDELLWRDFAHATLWHRPDVLEAPFDPRFSGFPWRDAPADWIAWRDGRTGYPIVDAAARQLVAEGFVHNRARMISASFLTKHLLLDFRLGEAHYLAWLADGDWAANDLGWQWSAGCGCDAQPYFRVFHPVIQGRKFDADGRYVRRWLPELARLPTKWIHAPWEAPPLELRAAGVRLGSEYPSPIVDHAEARDRYLKVATAHLARR